MPANPGAVAIAAGFTVSGFLVALAASWLLLAQMNFSYGFWHDHGGIGEAIARFGPDNRYKQGFHATDRQQRIALFHGINRAIHRGGEGLEALSYQAPGHAPQTLLREPEVVHLQDVAHLVTAGLYTALVALVVWLATLVAAAYRRQSLPGLKRQAIGLLGGVVVASGLVLAIGPVKVFYALHIWIFPSDHQWFFYYNESLMATMMYAPILFGWIALQWLVMALIAYGLLQWGAVRTLARLRLFQ